MPTQLGLLPNSLGRLHLAGNQLSGSIPTQLSMLGGLRWLDLNENAALGTPVGSTFAPPALQLAPAAPPYSSPL